MQQSEAYLLKSELALRKQAVLMHDAEGPPVKRQRTADDHDEYCARQYAYVQNSPLSPSRARSQVTVEEPAGLVEIVNDVTDVINSPESSGAEAEDFVIRSQSEGDAARSAAAPAVVWLVEASDCNQQSSDPGLILSSKPATEPSAGVSVLNHAEQESSIPLQEQSVPAQGSQHSLSQQQDIPEMSQERHKSSASDQHSMSKQADTDHCSGSAPSGTSQATVNNDMHQNALPSTAGMLPVLPPEQEADHMHATTAEQPQAAPCGSATDAPMTCEQLKAQGQYVVDRKQQQKVADNLKIYRNQVHDLQKKGQPKPDMISCKMLKGALTPTKAYGHISGVDIGARFGGRGEIAIVGIHTQMMRGIDSAKGMPCYAICMSGGYRDDVDEGALVNYTGEGGQKGNKQIKDQTWTAGNLALQQSCQQHVPVRVVRGSTEAINGKKELVYTYDGLYSVESAQMETGQDGFKICKFQLRALPGHSKAGQKVTFGAVKGGTGRFKQLALVRRNPAGQAACQSPTRKTMTGGALHKLEQQRYVALQARPGLLKLDITGGKESRRVPVFNEVDDERPPTSDQLEYLRYDRGSPATETLYATPEAQELLMKADTGMLSTKYDGGLPATETVCATPEARELLMKADAVMKFSNKCGVMQGGPCQYVNGGRLWETNKYGVYECSASATSNVGRHSCKSVQNRVVSRGIQLPLEVFKTSNGRGWGVRCAEDVTIGTFICDYVGRLITDLQADECTNDEYLFDLDHFVQLAEEPSSDIDESKLPAFPASEQEGGESDLHLVIDARIQGNVARFINHSCEGNLVIQPVFTNGCNAFLYRIALFASKDIPAFTELTYDYGYAEGVVHNRNMMCKCEAKLCRKRLL